MFQNFSQFYGAKAKIARLSSIGCLLVAFAFLILYSFTFPGPQSSTTSSTSSATSTVATTDIILPTLNSITGTTSNISNLSSLININKVASSNSYCLNNAVNADSKVILTNEGHTIYWTNNGNTLAEVVTHLSKLNYEAIVGFDANGKKLFNYTSLLNDRAYTTIDCRNSFLANNGTLIVHNHPNDTSFSKQDLLTESELGTPRIMIVGRTYVYILAPPTHGWGDPKEIADYYSVCYEKREQEIKDAIANHRDREEIMAEPDKPDDGSATWYYEHELRRQLTENPELYPIFHNTIWASHHAMIDVAGHFGYDYRCIPIDEFDAEDPTLFMS